MNAGQALGLLAGLGALNAIRGGREGTGKRFTGLLDMLDGGGAGASGDRFEGGGLISMLGNLFAKPLEAQQRVEDIAARTSERSSPLRPKLRPEGLLSEAQKEQIVMDQIVNPDVYNIGQTGEYGGVPSVAPTGLLEMKDDLVQTSSPAIDDGSEEYISGRRMYQAVPTMRQLDVPEIARLAQGPQFSPLFAADYRDYLEYLNTGRYPRD